MTPLLTLQNLSKSFGSNRILDDCSLAVDKGEIYGLVGLNGAGKTTLIRLLLGVLKPSRGSLSVLGADPWKHEASLYRRMGVVLEHDGFWGNLTFAQNMRLFAAAKGVGPEELGRYLETFWSMTDIYKSKKPVKFFSRGQRMQCALCRAFLGWPEIFFLDEPAVALDMEAYDHFTSLAKRAREGGATLLISSHQLETIDALCDRVGLLRDKKVTELTRACGDGEGVSLWELETDLNEKVPHVIEQAGGRQVIADHGRYRFRIDGASEKIPRLVKELVEARLPVRRIAPAPTDFSDAIRNEYRKPTTKGGQP
jgi:ABC-2 type transport system ATP-binding protein